jgi:hypothetical protein
MDMKVQQALRACYRGHNENRFFSTRLTPTTGWSKFRQAIG